MLVVATYAMRRRSEPSPRPASGTPLSRPSGRGDGGEGRLADPDTSGLTYSTNV